MSCRHQDLGQFLERCLDAANMTTVEAWVMHGMMLLLLQAAGPVKQARMRGLRAAVASTGLQAGETTGAHMQLIH